MNDAVVAPELSPDGAYVCPTGYVLQGDSCVLDASQPTGQTDSGCGASLDAKSGPAHSWLLLLVAAVLGFSRRAGAKRGANAYAIR